MERKALPLRLDPKLYEALSTLSSVAHRSMNQLVSEAVARYVVKESQVVEKDLQATLDRLRQYTRLDSQFDQAIEQVARAEVSQEDPLEGRSAASSTNTQAEVQQLLGDT